MRAQPFGSVTEGPVGLAGLAGQARAMQVAVQRLVEQAGLRRLATESEGLPECRVALLDGRIATGHPVLRGAHIEQAGAAGGPSEPESRHATMIASALVGRRGQALGLCPRCSLLSFPVAGRQFASSRLDPAAAAASVAAGIGQAVRSGASVIQLSLAFDPEQGKACSQIVSALSAAAARDVVTIIAAGNLAHRAPNPILQAPGAIGVAAADARRAPMAPGVLAPTVVRHGLLAPGDRVPGAVPPASMGWSSGSSMAACFVTAAFALLRCGFPRHTVGELLAALLHPGRSATTSTTSTTSTARQAVPAHLDADASAALLRFSRQPMGTSKTVASGSSFDREAQLYWGTASIAGRKNAPRSRVFDVPQDMD